MHGALESELRSPRSWAVRAISRLSWVHSRYLLNWNQSVLLGFCPHSHSLPPGTILCDFGSPVIHWYLPRDHAFVRWLLKGTQRGKKWGHYWGTHSRKHLWINYCWSLCPLELLASRYLCPDGDKLGPWWDAGSSMSSKGRKGGPVLCLQALGRWHHGKALLWAMTMCRYFPSFSFSSGSFLPSSCDLDSPASSERAGGANLVILDHPYLCF